MATIRDDETTPKLFTSILFKKQFKIKGRLFEYIETFPQSKPNTFVCKCLGEDDKREYVIKIVKLDELKNDLLEVSETTLDKNNISDTCVGRHQMGEWKFSETIAKLYTSAVVIYEISEIIDDELILVSEYRGIDLETYGKNKKGTLYLCEVLQIFIGLVNALLLIHKHDIIHRDIKPSNIFISYKTHKTANNTYDLIQVALGDLGIAMQDCKSNNQSTTVENSLDGQYNSITFTTTYSKNCGTPGYIAPESKNGIYSVKSDIWSLARSMIWLLFIRNNINNSHDTIINNLNEFEKIIIEEDLNNGFTILKLIENGNLANDIEGWREFISILKDMLNERIYERILPIQILKRVFKHETIDRPIILKQQFNYICDNFKNNRSLQFFYTINGVNVIHFNNNIRKDREFILEAVKQNGLALSYADESFKKDREIVLEAVKQDGEALSYADESFKKDREFILEAVKQNGWALEYVDKSFKKDREIVLEAVKQYGEALKYADESFKKDREIVERVSDMPKESLNPSRSTLSQVRTKFTTKDREVVLEAVKQDGEALKYADKSFKKDREIVLEAVKQSGWALKYADESFKKDREFILEAVKQDGEALEYADESFKKDREIVERVSDMPKESLNPSRSTLSQVRTKFTTKDREVVLEAVKQDGEALKYADKSFKKDREIVLEAVKENGWALKYADESFKKDREFILEAVKQSGRALEYADESFKKDREIVLEAVKQSGWALEYADESFKKDREFILEAVKQSGRALEYADKSFKKDREIVLEAVKQNGEALEYVDKSFKKDREIVLEAVKQSGRALKYADKSFKKDREFILEAVKQSGWALKYADKSLRKDREFILETVKQNGWALKYVDKSFKKDREIVLEAVKQMSQHTNPCQEKVGKAKN